MPNPLLFPDPRYDLWGPCYVGGTPYQSFDGRILPGCYDLFSEKEMTPVELGGNFRATRPEDIGPVPHYYPSLDEEHHFFRDLAAGVDTILALAALKELWKVV